MTHIELVFAFRRLRKKFRFSSIEADLYYELIAIWADEKENPFQYTNELLCASIGISEKSLISARNRIKQAGLIDFQSGHKRHPSTYRIKEIGCNKVSKSGSKNGSVNDSVSGGNASDTIEDIYIKYISKEVEEEELRSLDAHQCERWESFKKWFVNQKFKYVIRIEEQITPYQLMALLQKAPADKVTEKIMVIENGKAKYAKNKSVYLTVTNWLNRDFSLNGQQR